MLLELERDDRGAVDDGPGVEKDSRLGELLEVEQEPKNFGPLRGLLTTFTQTASSYS